MSDTNHTESYNGEQPDKKSTVSFDLFGEKTTEINGMNIDGVVHVKARELLEAMGFTVGWDDAAKIVLVRFKTVYPISDDELVIYEKIVEAEASGEDDKGKLLVANVVMNRVKSAGFPDNIKDVVFAPMQFEPTRTGAFERAVPSQATVTAVRQALCGEDFSQGALFFCSAEAASKPGNWHESALSRLFVHANHVFYKQKN